MLGVSGRGAEDECVGRDCSGRQMEVRQMSQRGISDIKPHLGGGCILYVLRASPGHRALRRHFSTSSGSILLNSLTTARGENIPHNLIPTFAKTNTPIDSSAACAALKEDAPINIRKIRAELERC